MEAPRETPVRGVKTRPPIDEYAKPAYGIHQIAEMIDEISQLDNLPSCSAPRMPQEIWQFVHDGTEKLTGRLNAILMQVRGGRSAVEAQGRATEMENSRRDCESHMGAEQKYVLQLQNAQRIVQDWLELQRRIIVRELRAFTEKQGSSEAAMEKLRQLQTLAEELRGVGILRKLPQKVERARLAAQVPIAELEKVFKVKIKINSLPDGIEIVQERGSPGWILQQHIESLNGDVCVAESRIAILRAIIQRIDLFLTKVRRKDYNPI